MKRAASRKGGERATAVTPQTPVKTGPIHVSPEEQHEMTAVAAYFLAERRGFAPGRELEDWRTASAAIEEMLRNMCAAGVTREHYERIGLRNALRLWVD